MMLYGDHSEGSSAFKEPDPKLAREMVDLLCECDLFRKLLEQLKWLEFEGRKYLTRIFEYALSQRSEMSVPYIEQRVQMLHLLVLGYEEKDSSVALSCDAILRACLQHESLTQIILHSTQPDLVQPFFTYIQVTHHNITPSSLTILFCIHPTHRHPNRLPMRNSSLALHDIKQQYSE